jgi:hypothetical protein
MIFPDKFSGTGYSATALVLDFLRNASGETLRTPNSLSVLHTPIRTFLNLLIDCLQSYFGNISVAKNYNSGSFTAATLNACIAATSENTRIVVSAGTWVLEDDVDFSGRLVEFEPGTMLTASSTQTVTFDITPVWYQQFIGGNVTPVFPIHMEVDPAIFGAANDGVTDDSEAIQKAIQAASGGGNVVQLRSGRYFAGDLTILDGVTLRGKGKNVTIIDMKNTYFTGIKTEDVTETDLSAAFLSDVDAGDTTATIANSASAGDFITFRDEDTLFSSLWTSSTIRPTYYMGEMHKIASANATTVTFEDAAVLDVSASGTPKAYTFTPAKDIEISDLGITRTNNTTPSIGVFIQKADGVNLSNIHTENTDSNGIRIDKSMNIDAYNISGTGINSDDCYGVSITDGTKHVNLTNYNGSGYQHALMGGGTGYAVPMFVNVSNINVTNSANSGGKSPSLDAHGCTAFFTYSNANVDYGLNMSGLGHTANNINSKDGVYYIYEGGKNITHSKIRFADCEAIYSNHAIRDSTFKDVEINILSGLTGTKTNSWAASSNGNTYRNFAILNHAVDDAADETAADALLNANSFRGLILRDNDTASNITMKGFAEGVYVDGANSKLDGLRTYNCGWQSALTSYESNFRGSLNAENASINDVIITNTNAGMSFTSRALRFDNIGTGSGGNISVRNVHYGADNTRLHYYDAYIDAAFTDMRLDNISLDGGAGGATVNATGYFTNNKIVYNTHKRVEEGSQTVTGFTDTPEAFSVTFATAFASAPKVQCTPSRTGGGKAITIETENITTTGFTGYVSNRITDSINADVNWRAYGI